MTRALLRFSLVGLLAYAGLCAYLYVAQDSMLYFPTAEVTAPRTEVIALYNDTERLKIWKVGNGTHAVLYFGGNGENVANNIDGFDGLLEDATFYLANYRGYGGSSGRPGEAAFVADAALLYDTVRPQHATVSVIGRSLGSGVATWLAANREVTKLILVTPFDSVENVASQVYPYVPVSLLLRDKFRSVDYAPAITAPVLVLLAGTDSVIPHQHAIKLVNEFPESQVTVRTLSRTTHNTISRADAYYPSIRQFLSFGDTSGASSKQRQRNPGPEFAAREITQ